MSNPSVVQILLWIGAFLAVGEHVSIIFSEWIRAEKHKRMLRGEMIGYAAAAVLLGATGAMLANWARSPFAGIPALLLWCAIFSIHGKHRRIVMAFLRRGVSHALSRGQVARAKVLGARLFDLMNVDRLLGKSRSVKWRFAKSAMVLARMREILGDYTLAERLYGWAISDLVDAGLTRKRTIRPRYLARAFDAGCGQIRAAAFRDPAKAASLLKMLEELARGAGADAATKVVMVGGQISTVGAVASQRSIREAILVKASLAISDGDLMPGYEAKYAAFLLARQYFERDALESALTLAEDVARSLDEHVDVRDFFLWLRNEELRSALLEGKGKYEEARRILRALTAAVEERLAHIAEAGNEKELLSLSEVAVGIVTRLVGLTAQRFSDRNDLVQIASDAVICLKGIAGSIRMNVAAALSTDVADGFENDARKAVELRGRLAQRWTEGAKSFASELDEMELERMEALLISERLGEKAAWTSRDANAHTVREYLHDGERLFDFVRTAFADGEHHYVMFTLSAMGGDAVRLTDLGPAVPIDASITQWRTFVQLGANPSLSEPNTAFLQTHIIDRMLAAGTASRWTIAADGALASLPFEAFFTSDAKRLVEKYECAYLSTSNELLLRRRPRARKGSQPVVVAAPDYEHALHSSSDHDSSRSWIFEPLPLAASEGARVAKLVGGQLFAGADATVGRLKRIASPRVLHVATHAFALGEPETSTADGALPEIPAWERLRLADDPMLRAGLALAGVNTVFRGEAVPPEVGSGVLSALEASALDLRETDLVVLSACDTGRGQLHRGEGILGLKRGFSIAGARAIVISLWRVPDTQTCDLMVDFHRGVAANMAFTQALRQAKLNVMRAHPQPLYWAAFVCCGDAYRSLDPGNERGR